MRESGITRAISAIENAEGLDPVIETAAGVVNSVIRKRRLRDLLHGVPFGHPVHPVAVHIPLGAWVSAGILDLVPGNSRASRTLVGVGVLSVIPTAIAGYTDWSDLHPEQMRVGIVHAFGNAAATMLYAASFVLRSSGRTTAGKTTGYLGLTAVIAAGWLGGHLSYRLAAGANHAEDVPHRFPQGWQDVAAFDELPDGELVERVIGEVPLAVLRRGAKVDVVSGLCTHLSGPLTQGELIEPSLEEDADGNWIGGSNATGLCVSCPWHGSVFSLETAEVVHGPATAPLSRFETRIAEGRVEVLLPNAG
jgi:nitrite reductase/ring-hydroxylating ferredoxin subunit/uncharacterized membrane protein